MNVARRKELQAVINNTITEVNKARAEFGLPPIQLLKGTQTMMNSCPIAKGLGIRNKVTYSSVVVRSRKAAERLSKAWGGAAINTTAGWGKGYKDFKWSVIAPAAFGKFVITFDAGELTELAHTSRNSGKLRKYSKEAALEQSFKSNVKKVSELICSPETAKKIVAYL